MGKLMLEYRLTEMSIHKYLEGLLDANGWGSKGFGNGDVVKLLISYPQDEDLNNIRTPDSYNGLPHEIVLPVVAVELVDSTDTPFEIGSFGRESRRGLITVMGYEESITQDLAYQIYEWMKFNDYIPLLNFNASMTSPTEAGKIFIEGLRLVPVRIIGSPDVADRHRFEIEFVADTYNTAVSSATYPTS